MSVLSSRKAPLSLSERTNAANAKSAAALSIFKDAAADLDAAAVELDDVAAQAEQVIRDNAEIAAQAENAAYEHRVRATAIRAIYEPLVPTFSVDSEAGVRIEGAL